MTSRRTLINLVTVIVASAVLLLFAVTQLLASAVLDNTYPLFVQLPEAGGLLENKEVTYRGTSVGEIEDVHLCGDDTLVDVPECDDVEAVMVQMGIQKDVEIPEGVDVVVLRQSAVGEQALDIRPYVATGPDSTYYEQGDVLRPGSVTLPTKPQDLLELADRVFGPVDEESAARLISELADAVEGRSEDVRAILADSATFSEAVADNGEDLDRLFRASRVVNASLAENREVLGQVIADLADSAELVGDIRDEVDALLDTAPTTLAATTRLLERGDADLACIIRDLADVNTFINQPEVFEDAEEALRQNEFFFDAFRIIGPTSARGNAWIRVMFVAEPEPPARRYEPKRPIPATLPGGACESVFGPGAGSAQQPGFQLAVVEGEVIRPEDDRQGPQRPTLAAGAAGVGIAGDGVEGVEDGGAGDAGAAASAPGLVLVVGLACALLLTAIRQVRRRG